jgi:hypothetical protein
MLTAGVRVYAAGTGRKGSLEKNLSSSSFPSGLFSLFSLDVPASTLFRILSVALSLSLFSICQHLYVEEKERS